MSRDTDAIAAAWLPRLAELCDALRDAARGALCTAVEARALGALSRQAHQGVGDVTYAIDVPAERALERWFEDAARTAPLSVLSEETGWRHLGPGPRGGVRDLDGFDHGGPRLVVDPIDGTRNLMTDLRSAWSVVGLAPPGPVEPRLADLSLGILSEIPDSRAATFRRLVGVRGSRGSTHESRTPRSCRFELARLADRVLVDARAHANDRDVRVDHAYFPFFKYMADLRPAIAEIEARFFERLESHEGSDVRNCYDDQYISNGGQLALLTLGTYRMIADLRAWLAERRGRPTLTTKPYDIAGAVICAEAAGAVLTTPEGAELDFPIDAVTPVSFVGWHNTETRMRLEPHLRAVLR